MKDVCIVYAGTKFDTRYIVQKRRQLDHYCSVPTRLTVLTDDPATVVGLGLRDTRAVLLPDWPLSGRELWWFKVYMFASRDYIDWYGPVLYLDLDTVIVGDIAHFWTHEPQSFMILQDFNRAFISDYPVSNSSVMRFDPDQHHEIHRNFDQNWHAVIRQFRGDQDYLTNWFKTHEGMQWWPREWCMSYKWEILHGGSKHGGQTVRYPEDYYQPEVDWIVPEQCSVVVFHGKPMLYDTHFGMTRVC